MNSFTEDFTEKHYREILEKAASIAPFIGYDEIDSNQKFILWRHDCDFSLNRALKLAEIEFEFKLKSTFFLNPHCEGYNIYEKSQFEIVKKIIDLGHNIGLHFEAGFYDSITEEDLEQKISDEARLLNELFSISVQVFSFHNPTVKGLSWNKSTYGGLINCYASFFHNEVSYCSDSNGYWRHNRLFDFLETSKSDKIQILTHAEWWQENPMHARDRIFRCINDRARNNLRIYDDFLEFHNRDNQFGSSDDIQPLRKIDIKEFELLDFLLNNKYYGLAIEELKCFFYKLALNRKDIRITENSDTGYENIRMIFDENGLILPGEITNHCKVVDEIFKGSFLTDCNLVKHDINFIIRIIMKLIVLIHLVEDK
jgi:hypothetical protein